MAIRSGRPPDFRSKRLAEVQAQLSRERSYCEGPKTFTVVAAFYGGANGITTIVRGMAVPEIVTRDGYGAVNGSLVAPMNVMTALAPLGARAALAGERRLRGSPGRDLRRIPELCAGFWFAAARSER